MITSLLLAGAFASTNAIPSKGPAPTLEIAGLTMGAPIAMSECAVSRTKRYASVWSGDSGPRPCYMVKDGYFDKPGSSIAAGVSQVGFMLSDLPRGVKLDRLDGTTINGELHTLKLGTDGVNSQESLLQQLTEKYGEPSDLTRQPLTTRMGVQYDATYAMWKFDNLEVIFIGMAGSIDRGQISVNTPAGDAQEQARREAEKAKEPRL